RMSPLAYVFGIIMLANGLQHIVGSIYMERLMPGVYSSPLLLICLSSVTRRGLEFHECASQPNEHKYSAIKDAFSVPPFTPIPAHRERFWRLRAFTIAGIRSEGCADLPRGAGRMRLGLDAGLFASRAPLNIFIRRGIAIIPTEFLPARVSTFQAISIS